MAEKNAAQQITKNLASNVDLSLTSGQLSLVTYLETTGSKVSTASLLTAQSTTLSTELSGAPANNFDSEYVQLTQTQLKDYASALKQIFSSSDPANQKVILRNLYAGANLLLKESNSTETDL